jgi:hypothetical protein
MKEEGAVKCYIMMSLIKFAHLKIKENNLTGHVARIKEMEKHVQILILHFIISFYSRYLEVDWGVGIEMDPRHIVMRVYGLEQPDAAYAHI